MIGAESRSGNENGLVSLDFQVASEEFDRYVGRFCGGVVGSVLGQWCEACGVARMVSTYPFTSRPLLLLCDSSVDMFGNWGVVVSVRMCQTRAA